MKRVQRYERTETAGMVRVVVIERDADAPVGSAASEATSRVLYEGKDQIAARAAEEEASRLMWEAPAAPAKVEEPKAFRPFVRA